MRFLFTTFEGGGHVPPALRVAGVLHRRGHDVLVVSDEANRPQAEGAGLPFEPWRTAPNRTGLAGADDPLDDWRDWWPPRIVRRVCQGVVTGPSQAYAADAIGLIGSFRPDVIVSQELLFGVLAAAEAAGVPAALLTANVWCFPTQPSVPPFGPGFAPARTAFARHREGVVRRMIASWYDAGLDELNRARQSHGLRPLARTLDQLKTAGLVLLGTAQSFDYGSQPGPGFAYAGPLADMPGWAGAAGGDDPIEPDRPNVLVSFSTAYPGQERTVARIIEALAPLPVKGIATLGPAVDPGKLPHADNVAVFRALSHDAIVPRCRLVICHGGHGTVIRPLIHGVPVLCIPMGRDQPENAQRIVHHGAGIRLSRRAGRGAIRRAAQAILGDPAYARNARRVGEAIRRESDGGARAADLLETLGAR